MKYFHWKSKRNQKQMQRYLCWWVCDKFVIQYLQNRIFFWFSECLLSIRTWLCYCVPTGTRGRWGNIFLQISDPYGVVPSAHCCTKQL